MLKQASPRILVMVSISLLTGACGARQASVGVEGEQPPVSPPKTTPPQPPEKDRSEGGTSTSHTAADCVVAVRLDVCCPVPEPAEASAVQADRCLVPYPFVFGVEPRPPECAARREREPCDDGCGPLNKRPQSVFAARDPQSGQCVFVNECEQDSDCQQAVDRRLCCPCAEAWPTAYVTAQQCLDPVGGAADPPPAEQCQRAACDPEPCPICAGGMGFRPLEPWCLKPPGIGPTQCAMR